MPEDTYRKRAYTVKAFQWQGTRPSRDEVSEWMRQNCVDPGATGLKFECPGVASLWTAASKAWCSLQTGDWVVQEAGGMGFYPVAKNVFERTYYKYDKIGD